MSEMHMIDGQPCTLWCSLYSEAAEKRIREQRRAIDGISDALSAAGIPEDRDITKRLRSLVRDREDAVTEVNELRARLRVVKAAEKELNEANAKLEYLREVMRRI